MSYASYLCCCDTNRIYPEYQNPAFDSSEHTLAVCFDGVPVLWVAMFRPGDIQEHTFGAEGDEYSAWAPLTTREQALVNLRQSRDRLNLLLGELGPLDAHLEMMEQLLTEVTGTYITASLDEIAQVFSPEGYEGPGYRALFERVLAYLAGEGEPTAELRRDYLYYVAGLDDEVGIASPRIYLDSEDYEELEAFNMAHVMGDCHIRPTPWA